MRAGGGKRKGGAFERDICRIISLAWSGGVYKDLCWRSAGSGSHATVSKSKVKAHHGDICAMSPIIEPLFKIFNIECKFYKKIDITDVLRGNKGSKLMQFWRQTLRSAKLSHRMPVLIARRNNFPTMLVLKLHDALKFAGAMKSKPRFMSLGSKLAIFNLDDFIDNVNMEKFISVVQGMRID